MLDELGVAPAAGGGCTKEDEAQLLEWLFVFVFVLGFPPVPAPAVAFLAFSLSSNLWMSTRSTSEMVRLAKYACSIAVVGDPGLFYA